MEQGAAFSNSGQQACDSREEGHPQEKANQQHERETMEALRVETLACVKARSSAYWEVPAVLWQDREFVLSLFNIRDNRGSLLVKDDAIHLVSNQLKADADFMIALFRKRWAFLQYADRSLLEDPEFILRLGRFCCCAIGCAKFDWKANREFGLAAAKQDGSILYYLEESLRGDKEIVLAAVTQHGESIEYAQESLRGNKEVALAAVTQWGPSIRFLHHTLRKNEEVALAAVTNYGKSIRYVHESLQSNRQIALAAVKKDGNNLEYVDVSLRSDREIALAAISQDRHAARWVAGMLSRYDHEVFAHVVFTTPEKLWKVSQAIQYDIAMVTKKFSTLVQARDFVHDTQETRAAFMAFLGCIHTGNTNDNPCCFISEREKGEETSLGLKQHIAEYAGFPFAGTLTHFLAIERTVPILENFYAGAMHAMIQRRRRFPWPWNGLCDEFFPTSPFAEN